MFISLLILLSRDVQSNPGPVFRASALNMCTLNIRSFTNPIHYTAIAILAVTHNIDVFVVTKTWISPCTTSAQLYLMLSLMDSPSLTLLVMFLIHALLQSSIDGGGTA